MIETQLSHILGFLLFYFCHDYGFEREKKKECNKEQEIVVHLFEIKFLSESGKCVVVMKTLEDFINQSG